MKRFILTIFLVKMPLAFSMPVPASGECSVLENYLHQYKEVLANSIYIQSSFLGSQKHFRVEENNWGAKYFVYARVKDVSEANSVYNSLEKLGYKVAKYTPGEELDKALPLPLVDGSLELVVGIDTPKSLKEFVESISGQLVQPQELIPLKLDSIDEMRRWVFWNFAEFRAKTSAEEKKIMFSMRTADYQQIQNALRESKGAIPGSIKHVVTVMDAKIQQGFTDRSILLYHTTTDPVLEEIWSRFQEKVDKILLPEDPAYKFTSMSKDFVEWWRNYKNQGKGVVLEISVEKGSHIIPMEKLTSEGQFVNTMSELEFVLQRKAKIIAERVSVDSKGVKIIHCRLEP